MALSERKKRIIKISVAVVVVLLFLLVIAPYSVSAIVLNKVFGRRFETKDYLRFYVSDFDGLQAQKHTFDSDGRQLVGYRYYSDNANPKGLVILSHGFGGGGQNGYMDVSYYFVQNGYEVFGYDATGNDESTGKVGGLPQGIKDLNSALSYTESLPQFASLPKVLWGHSWGGYSAVCALNYNKDIKAVASIAGFNRASDMIEAQGVHYGGKISKVLLPWVRSVEGIRFKDYSSASGVNAVKSSTAGVFIAHGTADTVVPMQYGYDAYYSQFSLNPRVKFLKCEDKGHAEILYSEDGWQYTRGLESGAAKISDREERRKFIEEIDRGKLSSRLNTGMFREIVDFYDLWINT